VSSPVEADREVTDEIRPAGRWASLVAGIVPATIGAAAALLSPQLGLGTPTEPGPGMWPFLLGVSLFGASLVLLALHSRLTPCEAFTPGVWAVGLGVASLVAFTVLVPLVGFEYPAAALIALWIKVIGGESWRTALVVAVCATAALYALFILALGVSFPHLIAI
jgi:putative tricarboxylic transport membrane protein